MNHGIVSKKQLIDIESALQQELIANGVLCALLIDTAGNTVAEKDDGKSQYDTYAFAALAAGNYATVDSMAKLVGESDFAQLYHKGEKVSIHFSKMSEELLLITIFDNELALGFLRLQVGELRGKLQKICASSAS
jgi:predicted regulator of Ras-like GTPase activity (Roadblock/LC7/MglB family)